MSESGMATLAQPDIRQACEAFLSRCKALNLSPGTVNWYGFILRDLAGFLEPRAITELSAVGTAHLRDFLVHLRQRGQASETVLRTFGALRCAFGFWTREGQLARIRWRWWRSRAASGC